MISIFKTKKPNPQQLPHPDDTVYIKRTSAASREAQSGDLAPPPVPQRSQISLLGSAPPAIPPKQTMDQKKTPLVPSRPTGSGSSSRNNSGKSQDSRSSPSNQEPDCLPFYHEDINGKDEAERVISVYVDKNGSYLLRKSTQVHPYSITVIHNSTILHVHVQRTKGKFTLGGDQKFESIGELVKHYSRHSVPNSDSVTGLKLQIPIDKKDPLIRKSLEKISTNLVNLDKPRQPPPQDQAAKSDERKTPNRPSELNTRGKTNQGGSGGAKGGYIGTSGWRKVNDVGYETIGDGDDDAGESDYQYYSRVIEDESKLDRLIQHLYNTEQPDNLTCECGLKVEEAELPHGFSFHISRQAETYGRIFFVSPHGETMWQLPIVVSLDLEPIHQARLRCVLAASNDYVKARPNYVNAPSKELRISSLGIGASAKPYSGGGMAASQKVQKSGNNSDDSAKKSHNMSRSFSNSSSDSSGGAEKSTPPGQRGVASREGSLGSGSASKTFQSPRTPPTPSNASSRNLSSSSSGDYVEADIYEAWASYPEAMKDCDYEYLNNDQIRSKYGSMKIKESQELNNAILDSWAGLNGGYIKSPPKDNVKVISPRRNVGQHDYVNGNNIQRQEHLNKSMQDELSNRLQAGRQHGDDVRRNPASGNSRQVQNQELASRSPMGLPRSTTVDFDSRDPSRNSNMQPTGPRRSTEPNVQYPVPRTSDRNNYLPMNKHR